MNLTKVTELLNDHRHTIISCNGNTVEMKNILVKCLTDTFNKGEHNSVLCGEVSFTEHSTFTDQYLTYLQSLGEGTVVNLSIYEGFAQFSLFNTSDLIGCASATAFSEQKLITSERFDI